MKANSFVFIAALGLTAYGVANAIAPATAAQTTDGKLAVSAAFAPNPPSTQRTDRITISVKDATGKPVRGATVKIATSMPTMSMKGADIVAQDHGNGTYTADAKLNYATKWAFDITAQAKGKNGKTHIEKDLK